MAVRRPKTKSATAKGAANQGFLLGIGPEQDEAQPVDVEPGPQHKRRRPEPEQPKATTLSFALNHVDAILALNQLPADSVDLIITDPPYESLEKHRKIGTTTRLKHSKSSSNDWFVIFPNSRFDELFTACFRVLKKNRHMYLFCDAETLFTAKPAGERAGFKFWKPIVWDKQRIGMGYHYRSRYEFVLFFEKGKRKLNDLGIPDVLASPRVWNGYPTEKPSAIAEILVGQSTVRGETVLDPFCGSGSTGAAALALGRNFLGNDTEVKALEHTRNRLSGLVPDVSEGVWPGVEA